MAYSKGVHSSTGNRGRRWPLMLLLTFVASLLAFMFLHSFRERRIYNLVLTDKHRQLLALHLLLHKNNSSLRDHAKEFKRKNEEMKEKMYSLGSQKIELERIVLETQSMVDSLRDKQKTMESEMEEKQIEIRMLEEKWSHLGKQNPQVIALRENLEEKEAEIDDLKRRPEVPVKRKKEGAELENGDRLGNHGRLIQTDEHNQSQEALQVEGKGDDETRSERITDGNPNKKNEDSQDDDGALVPAKENNTITQRQPEKVEHNGDDEGQALNDKHGNVSRLLGNNGISEIHAEINMDGRKAYRDKQHELKDKTGGRVSGDENGEKEEEETGGDNNTSKEEAETKSLKPENHEERQDAQNKKVVDTNHHLKETGIEEQEDNGVQQSWSRKLINEAANTAGQEKEASADDDFFRESQSDFEDEENRRVRI